jgi:hypothetical protein
MKKTTVKLGNLNELQIATSFIPSGDMNLQQSN